MRQIFAQEKENGYYSEHNTPGNDSVWNSRRKNFDRNSHDCRPKKYEQGFIFELDNTFSMAFVRAVAPDLYHSSHMTWANVRRS